MNGNEWPVIIQGGMGAGISGWRLARAVAGRGQLGVVSGVGLDTLLVRRLIAGDSASYLRQAIAQFPVRHAAQALERWLEAARQRSTAQEPGAYPALPLYRHRNDPARQQLIMLAAFVEVWLARRGHDGLVGINLLTKIQPPVLPSLYGAMLAGVDFVLMGAGIPREIPVCLDALAAGLPAEWKLEVAGPQPAEPAMLRFDPRDHFDGGPPRLTRPRFLPIVSSNLLATVLARKSSGRIDGLIVEGWTAGGHNAPPRGQLQLDERGEPVYGPRDVVDLDAIRELGLPFWLAGGSGNPEGLQRARAAGATGIQVGTLFAYCDESGMAGDLKQSVLASAANGEAVVRTDPRASPTGYPFKVVDWPGDPSRGVERERVCDMGYLREAYVTASGAIGFRCSGEPVDQYVRKGGKVEDTVGRRCLCNSLLATCGFPQHREGGFVEPPVVTSGDDLANIAGFLGQRQRYSAADVLEYLLEGSAAGIH